jgi:hypothetical protein
MARRMTLLGFSAVVVLMFVAGAYNGYLNGFTPSEAVWWAVRSLIGIIGLVLVGLAFSRVVDWLRSRHAR